MINSMQTSVVGSMTTFPAFSLYNPCNISAIGVQPAFSVVSPHAGGRYGHQITPEEIEQFGEDGIPEVSPTLDQFKEQIDSYEKLYLEMEQVEPVVTFDTWFRLDCKPFKAALLNTIKRWSLLFKQYLIDHVTNRCVRGWMGLSDGCIKPKCINK